MKTWLKLLIIMLGFFVAYKAVYFYCVYKDEFLSREARMSLKGKIAYSVNGHYIKVVDAASGKSSTVYTVPKHIFRNRGFVTSPYFSPSGDMLVYSQGYSLWNYKLFIMDADGKNPKLFIDLGDGIYTLSPSWSPNGNKIAFIVSNDRIDKSQGLYSQGLYVVDMRNNLSIKRISQIEPDLLAQPSWSSDSKRIAFSSRSIKRTHLRNDYYEERNMGGIYMINVENDDVEDYVDLVSQPSWSPDGNHLAYETKDGYYVIDLTSKYSKNKIAYIPYKNILFSQGGEFPIRFSPDGKYVAFCKEIWPGLAGIYVCPVDNPKKQIRITFDDQAIIGMSWGK